MTSPIARPGAVAPSAGTWSRRFCRLFMHALFRSLFGWRGGETGTSFRHPSTDGSMLAGAVHACACAPAKGVVIVCHPFFKFGMHYFFKNGYQDWLNAAGYHVVGFNFKGFGASAVEGLRFSDDVCAMVAWTRERYPDLPLHLLATSFGAFQSIHAIASGRVQVDSALFDSAPATLEHFFGKGIGGAVVRYLSRSRWSHSTGTHDILRMLPLPPATPHLFLYGDADEYIMPPEMAALRRACGDARVQVFPQCGHLELRKVDPQRYIATVLEFFERQGRAPLLANFAKPAHAAGGDMCPEARTA